MFLKKSIFFLLFVLARVCTFGQFCVAFGQNPNSAFPVCGVNVFSQKTVPLCKNNTVPVAACSSQGGGYPAVNPFWYKFTCYTSGTFGFVITPNNLGDDYDWQIFDVTGHPVTDVFSDPSLFVTGNWSGSYGLTGASSTGSGPVQCGSDPASNVPTFSSMPTLIAGHNYLLLISHYTDTQSGYTLTFGGGTASITDPNIPQVLSATAACDATLITVSISKKVSCSSLASDGSDFSISAPGVAVVSAVGNDCSGGFDLDAVTLQLNQPLTPGNYTLTIKNGHDGNTLLDYCNNAIPAGSGVGLNIAPPPPPTPFDSIAPVHCAPDSLSLIFSNSIRCSSIASNGSDFIITGPSAVKVIGASGNCTDDIDGSSKIEVYLDGPIVVGGSYSIMLVTGSDGNTLINECGLQTPAGSSLNFTTSDTVSASFDYKVYLGCKIDTIQFSQSAGHGIDQWQWQFGNGQTSSSQNPEVYYGQFGVKNIILFVSNGVCTDSSSTAVNLDNVLKADFTVTDSLCPKDKAVFQDLSAGDIISWSWDFGDGTTSSSKTPFDKQYFSTGIEKSVLVRLIVENGAGCLDTATKEVKLLRNCYITVASAFTPNGDGVNDYLYPLNAYKAVNLEFRIFNRFGQQVFESKQWTNKWDGTINGKAQDIGTYVWMLQYTDKDTGEKYSMKGTSVLVR